VCFLNYLLILLFSDYRIEIVFYSDNIENRLVCRMYTKSELESMTFKELQRLARENSVSQRWKTKVIVTPRPLILFLVLCFNITL
jgi:hypothetical protein